MADRRMIHRKVIESDSFYGLPEGAQAMYSHLTINADEDGFVNCAGSIAARMKNGKAMLKKLVEERFVLQFGEICVVKHWRIGNSLKNDRLKPPTYPGVAAQIWVKPNRAYTDHPVDGCQTLLELKTGIQSGFQNGIQNGIRSESKMESQQNRTELNRTEQNRTEAGADVFERLWQGYPADRRGSEVMARNAFGQVAAEDWDRLLDNLERWKKSEQWVKNGGQYVPYLCNWLDRGVWQTRPPEEKPQERPLDPDEVAAARRMLEM